MMYLLSVKINYPEKVIMLRGNHESRNQTKSCSFKRECLAAYDREVYQLIMKVFDCLPLACLVNKVYLAVHGGISPGLKDVNQINEIDRFKEIPLKGLFCDLVWSDPFPGITSINENIQFLPNHERNCSILYGKALVKKFLSHNKLLAIIRSN